MNALIISNQQILDMISKNFLYTTNNNFPNLMVGVQKILRIPLCLKISLVYG